MKEDIYQNLYVLYWFLNIFRFLFQIKRNHIRLLTNNSCHYTWVIFINGPIIEYLAKWETTWLDQLGLSIILKLVRRSTSSTTIWKGIKDSLQSLHPKSFSLDFRHVLMKYKLIPKCKFSSKVWVPNTNTDLSASTNKLFNKLRTKRRKDKRRN